MRTTCIGGEATVRPGRPVRARFADGTNTQHILTSGWLDAPTEPLPQGAHSPHRSPPTAPHWGMCAHTKRDICILRRAVHLCKASNLCVPQQPHKHRCLVESEQVNGAETSANITNNHVYCRQMDDLCIRPRHFPFMHNTCKGCERSLSNPS